MLSSSDIQGKGFGLSDGVGIVVIVSLIGGFTWSMLQGVLNPPTLSPIGTIAEDISEISKNITENITPTESEGFQFPSVSLPSMPSLPDFPKIGVPHISLPQQEPKRLYWQVQGQPCAVPELGNHWSGQDQMWHCLVSY